MAVNEFVKETKNIMKEFSKCQSQYKKDCENYRKNILTTLAKAMKDWGKAKYNKDNQKVEVIFNDKTYYISLANYGVNEGQQFELMREDFSHINSYTDAKALYDDFEDAINRAEEDEPADTEEDDYDIGEYEEDEDEDEEEDDY